MPVIIGSGGHAKVVIDALLASGVARDEIMVRDGNPARAGVQVQGIAVIVPELAETLVGALVHIAIGDAVARARLDQVIRAMGAFARIVQHPMAIVSASAKLGEGSFIAAGALVGPDAEIGRGVIINHCAVIDHDCIVGDFSHIAPNATLGGGVRVGSRTLIGAGAIVLPGVSIGDDVTVGAGAIVLRAIGDGQRWVGNPAKRLVG